MKATIREIARQAKVHHGTVSIVLNDSRGGTRVSDATRQRVLQIAEELGYQPNRAAQQLRTQRSHVVGLLVSDLENPFFARLVSLVSSALTEAGFDCVLAMRRQGEISDMHHLQALMSRQVDGLIVWIESQTEIRTWLEKNRAERNLVILGQRVPGCDSIDALLATATREMLEHLVEQGYRKIAYLAPEEALARNSDPRQYVYSDFVKEAGLPEMICAFEGNSQSPSAAIKRAELIGRMPEAERPDALFCFNDMAAIGALLGVRRAGLEPPHDMGITGCDGVPLASQMDVPLTTIDYPLEQMCREAVAMLISRIEANSNAELELPPVRYHSFHAPLKLRASSLRITENRMPRSPQIPSNRLFLRLPS